MNRRNKKVKEVGEKIRGLQLKPKRGRKYIRVALEGDFYDDNPLTVGFFRPDGTCAYTKRMYVADVDCIARGVNNTSPVIE